MSFAQSNNQTLPYAQIPDYPGAYTPENILARMIDGLGFRYYWATEVLHPEDLGFKPSPDARTILETVDHIKGLVLAVNNTIIGKPTERPQGNTPDFETLRKETLTMLENASNFLKQNSGLNLEEHPIRFKRGDQISEFPFWNLLNGQLADAIYHTGQIITIRRIAGNPVPEGVNVFLGTKKD